MRLYMVYNFTNFGEGGSTHSPVGIYSSKDTLLEAMNIIHKHHDLSTWGLHDYQVYEIELDAMPDNEPWFTSSNYTELNLDLDEPNKYTNKVVIR